MRTHRQQNNLRVSDKTVLTAQTVLIKFFGFSMPHTEQK